jgi:hypothetical protein
MTSNRLLTRSRKDREDPRRSQRAKPSWMACARADFIEEHYHRAPLCRGRLDRYAGLVAELVKLGLDIIVTSANEATVVAKRANIQIPVVMLNVRELKANRNS